MFSPILVLFFISFQVFCADAAPGRVGILPRRFHGEQELRMKKRSSVDRSACLEAHNTKRALHGASPLTWDAGLAQDAQKWANHLADIGHLQPASGTNQGENLYSSYKSNPDASATCEDAVETWYREIKDYDFRNPGHAYNNGRFTQVVWKGTTKVGVGKATLVKNGLYGTIIVARYLPPGNMLRKYAENVQQK